MTKLLDEVARAIARAGQPDQVDALATSEWLPEAHAALSVIAKWLREPSKELLNYVATNSDCYYSDLPEALRALAAHIEDRK